ncbi:Serine phosphatase RsbU, regulator of sigma subunit [Abditibacterium utsteinense]|uniref:Serine phosphatase RsbU, regulator of sigma subunit n=1 Tax=Abditibacterium utsteinense TaxID=1960156 RepID=A0A2S8SUG4_9BACT|nr:PP2C family protein-serine/threonine phosphatase [Abditibacterium utsteinense]PQV64435.1 Serine phosphatase RsbU, regulator of sigma subunit [Abditibacterium utsteinense]
MVQAPTVIFAFSVLNLLLTSAGLLFVYFDWNAARRREYLYLYFSEERPSHEYFAAARRRRIQYTRLLCALGVLGLRQFLSIILAASVFQPDDWDSWLRWWNNGAVAPSVRLAVGLQPWIGFLEAIGLALLAYALLYEWKPKNQEPAFLTPVLAGFCCVWGVVLLFYVTNVLGASAHSILLWATVLSRIVILTALWLALQQRSKQNLPGGLFALSPLALNVMVASWFFLPTFGNLSRNPGIYPMGIFGAFAVLVVALARGTLNDYESMEMSRQRMGRERGVIFTFLKRLGAAFTTEVEVDAILKIILESALETTEASAGVIYVMNARKDSLDPRVVLNFFPPMYVDATILSSERRTEELEDEMRAQTFEIGQGIIGEVAKAGRARLIEDVRAEGIMLGTTTEYMRNRSMLVVPLRVRDETLGVMAVLNKQRGSFGADDQSLLQALADQASLSLNNALLTVEVAEQERLRRDLQIARDIQKRLLPDHCPTVPGFEIAARGTSALEVGGDYYDFFWVDDDHLGIVVADVSGKGVYAALVVAMIRSAFRTQAAGNHDVRDVLSRVNTFIAEDLRRDMFVTCVYGILEISTKKFSWARAGHEPLIVSHSGNNIPVDILSPDGFALGVIGAPEFQDLLEVQTIILHSGDRLLMFTDGLTEAMNSKGEEFGMEGILQSLADPTPSNGSCFEDAIFDQQHTCEPDEMKHLEEAVQTHVGDAPQSDDLTIVYLAAI